VCVCVWGGAVSGGVQRARLRLIPSAVHVRCLVVAEACEIRCTAQRQSNQQRCIHTNANHHHIHPRAASGQTSLRRSRARDFAGFLTSACPGYRHRARSDAHTSPQASLSPSPAHAVGKREAAAPTMRARGCAAGCHGHPSPAVHLRAAHGEAETSHICAGTALQRVAPPTHVSAHALKHTQPQAHESGAQRAASGADDLRQTAGGSTAGARRPRCTGRAVYTHRHENKSIHPSIHPSIYL
jgi:hypothetical protein